MAITRWDPFRDLFWIESDVDRVVRRAFGGEGTGAWTPALDVYEDTDRFVVTVELPGVDPEMVDVSVEDSTLTVKGEREFHKDLLEESFRRIERRYGSFSRTLVLPPTADPDRVEARFDKGVLTVEVPKAQEAKPRRIEVKTVA
ncbi:MAG TPA: Hsp20/alpha crystallin family protein [Actinomycetota bacterium]|nr:Hsp20/alpha crystallin family protein [Actinomycetota bacterium]